MPVTVVFDTNILFSATGWRGQSVSLCGIEIISAAEFQRRWQAGMIVQ
jgi:hypothetical protein